MEPQDHYLERAVNTNFVNIAETEETGGDGLVSAVDNFNFSDSFGYTETDFKVAAVDSFKNWKSTDGESTSFAFRFTTERIVHYKLSQSAQTVFSTNDIEPTDLSALLYHFPTNVPTNILKQTTAQWDLSTIEEETDISWFLLCGSEA